MAGVVLEPGRIANGINLQMKTFSQLGIVNKIEEKFGAGHGSGRLVAVDGGEDADADGIPAVSAAKGEARQGILCAVDFEGTQEIALHAGQADQRFEELLNRAAALFQ